MASCVRNITSQSIRHNQSSSGHILKASLYALPRFLSIRYGCMQWIIDTFFQKNLEKLRSSTAAYFSQSYHTSIPLSCQAVLACPSGSHQHQNHSQPLLCSGPHALSFLL